MKLQEAEYIPELGVSIVVLQEGEKTFEGAVYLHPDDMEVASSYAGCEFAEIKAEIKYYKWKYKELERDLKVLENMYHQFSQLKNFHLEKHTQLYKHFRKQIKIKQAEVNMYKETYEYLKDSYPIIVEERLKATKELHKRIQQIEGKREFEKNVEALGLNIE